MKGGLGIGKEQEDASMSNKAACRKGWGVLRYVRYPNFRICMYSIQNAALPVAHLLSNSELRTRRSF